MQGPIQVTVVLSWLAMALGASVAPVAAESPAGAFAFRGPGAARCDELVLAADDPATGPQARLRLALWLSGYLTHANRTTPGTFDLAAVQDDVALAGVVVNFCRQNPDKAVEPVVAAFVERIRGWAVPESSPQLVIAENGAEVRLREATLVRLQALLVERGVVEGQPPVPGQFDEATRAAIGKLQGGMGLPVTGLPDAALMLTLALAP